MRSGIFLAALGPLLATHASAQTIVNGGFETWPAGCPVNTPPNGWANFSTSLGPDQAGGCAGTVASFEGSSHMNLVWYSVNGLLEGAAQAITGLVINNTYEVSFHAIHDQGLYAATDPTVLEASINGTVLLTTPDLVSGDPWALYSFQFTATAATHVLAFRVAAGSSGTTGCVGVDAVTISASTGVAPSPEDAIITVVVDPASRALVIRSAMSVNEVEVLDALGRTVAGGPSHRDRRTVDLATQRPGVYLYRVALIDGRIATGRVILE